MTYDTTTTSADVILVRNSTNNDSSGSHESASTIPPRQLPQKHDHIDCSPSDDNRQLKDSSDELDGSVEVYPSSFVPSSSSQPSGSTSSSTSDIHEFKQEEQHDSLNKNNNIVGLRNECVDTILANSGQIATELASSNNDDMNKSGEINPICYNPALDDEIRKKLDKLNALSDLINSLEVQFDQANILFRETLKCSTDRLKIIAKTLGSKSIRHGRIYNEAKISVEQTQAACQQACVQFEQANNDHQFAKEAIREAETKLKQLNIDAGVDSKMHLLGKCHSSGFEFNDLGKLSLDADNYDDTRQEFSEYSQSSCDIEATEKAFDSIDTISPDKSDVLSKSDGGETIHSSTIGLDDEFIAQNENTVAHKISDHDESKIMTAAKLSEDLNQAINRLIDAENKRRQSEKLHLDQANKLIIAQENLLKLEREHGTSIKRSQIYFDEAKRFNVRLNSVKNDVARISEEIIAAKQAYARALSELEQFSEHLHLNSKNLSSLKIGSDLSPPSAQGRRNISSALINSEIEQSEQDPCETSAAINQAIED
jgi:hypothetical protein